MQTYSAAKAEVPLKAESPNVSMLLDLRSTYSNAAFVSNPGKCVNWLFVTERYSKFVKESNMPASSVSMVLLSRYLEK